MKNNEESKMDRVDKRIFGSKDEKEEIKGYAYYLENGGKKFEDDEEEIIVEEEEDE